MKIGILQTGRAPDELTDQHGDYDDMCANFIREKGDEIVHYPVLDGVLPSNVRECDAWLVTGSRFGVYENHDWIPPLEDLIREAYAKGIKLVGICFGHQIIAQALGGKVIKHDNGFGTGAMDYNWHLSDGEQQPIKLYAWHQDQVIEKSKDAEVIASSDFCKIAGLKYGEKALTVQAHPEFNKAYLDALITLRPDTYTSSEIAEQTRKALDTKIDADYVGDAMRAFIHRD